jgi:hypothetical protein
MRGQQVITAAVDVDRSRDFEHDFGPRDRLRNALDLAQQRARQHDQLVTRGLVCQGVEHDAPRAGRGVPPHEARHTDELAALAEQRQPAPGGSDRTRFARGLHLGRRRRGVAAGVGAARRLGGRLTGRLWCKHRRCADHRCPNPPIHALISLRGSLHSWLGNQIVHRDFFLRSSAPPRPRHDESAPSPSGGAVKLAQAARGDRSTTVTPAQAQPGGRSMGMGCFAAAGP